jgi:diaminopimelate epimerase
MAIVFHKMHGSGNDFVLLDLRAQAFEITPATARRLAERHTGIGCDQLLVLRPPGGHGLLADFEVWNADGSRAKHCGNGVRCIGLFLAMQGETQDEFRLGGPVASITGWVRQDGQVRVDMGQPEFRPERIPIGIEPHDGGYLLETEKGTVNVGAVSLGNPHAVVVVEDDPHAALNELGPWVSGHPVFPDGCNAGFAQVIDRNTVKLHVFERGSGQTRSCGTGACAAAVVLRRAGLIDAQVEILQEGGKLIIEWPGDHARIMMTGPAVHVFQGTLE